MDFRVFRVPVFFGHCFRRLNVLRGLARAGVGTGPGVWHGALTVSGRMPSSVQIKSNQIKYIYFLFVSVQFGYIYITINTGRKCRAAEA
jgi:hypothetical protein